MAKLDINPTYRKCDLGSWESVGSYLGRYYGPNGLDLGEIPISIACVTWDCPCEACGGEGEIVTPDADPDNMPSTDECAACDGSGECQHEGWVVAETPDEATEYHDVYETRDEAVVAAESLAEELDETPDVDSVVKEIAATGYFEDADADIIAHVVKAATQHSQGYLLITPDIGTRWTTNGYLQCDHIRLNATYGTEAEAAEALLAAIHGQGEDGESD